MDRSTSWLMVCKSPLNFSFRAIELKPFAAIVEDEPAATEPVAEVKDC